MMILIRKRHIQKIVLLLSCLFALGGCGRDFVSDPTEESKAEEKSELDEFRTEQNEFKSEQDEFQSEQEESEIKQDEFEADEEETQTEQDELEAVSEEEAIPKEIPQLPDTGRALEDFVPEGWKIWDSVELDFNEDGVPDYVGVLDDWRDAPRILFAIASAGTDGYYLDFQDINLIRTRGEGGVFGDPYQPLTTEGTSFTTHTYGGSAWRWSEDRTYTYREGVWWLTVSEETYGYYEYTTSYSKDDWENGVGIRKKRSSEFEDMDKNWDATEYDVEYELSLDGPLTLEQAGMRWWLAPDRVTDWEVSSITFGSGVELTEDRVKLPEEAYLSYCDENCALYTFLDESEGFYYLAMYRWQDKGLSVLSKEETRIDAVDDLTIYKGNIYYTTEIVENIKYKTMQDGKEEIKEEEDIVGLRLNRMGLNGTGKETIFEYRYPEADQEIMDSWVPYLALNYEISGNELVLEVYIGNEPHPFYRMKPDGSEIKKIGQRPKELGI